MSGLEIAAAAASAALPGGAPLSGNFPVVELRQYTLHDGRRGALIDIFEREFVESQEALGMKVIGTFRDSDRPNRFVWIRGFKDMDARLAGLSAFYSGPVWQAHRSEANATMIDSDNVLLLRAPVAVAAFISKPQRPAIGERRISGRIVANIYEVASPNTDVAELFEQDVLEKLRACGVPVLAWFTTETVENNYPRLPVREGERVLVWFARFRDDADYEAKRGGIETAVAGLVPLLARDPEVLRLEPTDRSELR